MPFEHVIGKLHFWYYQSPPARWHPPRLIEPVIEEIEAIVAGRGYFEVGGRVVAGALAGYLMLGLSGALVLCVLETLLPGSFRGNLDPTPLSLPDPAVTGEPTWTVDFIRINYFAFVSLTTVGYGDIVPVTPTAQIASILLSVAGPLYIATVMGVLISRLTIQREVEQERDEEEQRRGGSHPGDRP